VSGHLDEALCRLPGCNRRGDHAVHATAEPSGGHLDRARGRQEAPDAQRYCPRTSHRGEWERGSPPLDRLTDGSGWDCPGMTAAGVACGYKLVGVDPAPVAWLPPLTWTPVAPSPVETVDAIRGLLPEALDITAIRVAGPSLAAQVYELLWGHAPEGWDG